MRTLLVLGASRGLGKALAEGVPEPGDTVFLVSRSQPEECLPSPEVQRIWVQADVTAADAPEKIIAALNGRPLDVFIYNAGIWELQWTDSVFETISPADIRQIIDTNLTGLLLCVQALMGHLRRSEHGRIVVIGSTCGLENENSSLVAYAASKFGVRGAVHGLRGVCRPHGIAVTCISPGTIATEVPLRLGVDAALKRYGTERIPMADIVNLTRAILKLSPASCVKEVDMPAMGDAGV